MTEPSIYAKAIDVLNERGWNQGDPYEVFPDGGSVCLGTAIGLATGCKYAFCESEAHPDLAAAFRLLTGVLGQHVQTWNDATERTKEDVILLLKYADAGELETWKALYGDEA